MTIKYFYIYSARSPKASPLSIFPLQRRSLQQSKGWQSRCQNHRIDQNHFWYVEECRSSHQGSTRSQVPSQQRKSCRIKSRLRWQVRQDRKEKEEKTRQERLKVDNLCHLSSLFLSFFYLAFKYLLSGTTHQISIKTKSLRFYAMTPMMQGCEWREGPTRIVSWLKKEP